LEVSIGVLKILRTAAREPEKHFSFFKASHDWCWLNAKKGPLNPGEITIIPQKPGEYPHMGAMWSLYG